jgi:hypothetical protein
MLAALVPAEYGGALLGELADLIPAQRIDRAEHFMLAMAANFEALEVDIAEVRRRILSEPECLELAERGIGEAMRPAANERRAQIAELVARGLSSDELQAEEAKKLLMTLERLTGPEVIVLKWLALDRGTQEKRLFEERHSATLKPETDAGKALRESYYANLQALGLVIQRGPTAIRVASPLGRLLLQHIGALP